MPRCEKCWSDAKGNSNEYLRITESRKDNPCTPEEHAGDDAGLCPQCNRKTLHQHCGICMNQECNYEPFKPYYLYLHMNGTLISKPKRTVDMGGGPHEYFDSTFVQR